MCALVYNNDDAVNHIIVFHSKYCRCIELKQQQPTHALKLYLTIEQYCCFVCRFNKIEEEKTKR